MRKKFLAVAAATVMTMSMAMTAMAAAPAGYAGYYSFDETLDNAAEGGTAATLTGPKVTVDATVTEATFVDGKTGKAVSFTGAGSYGLNLGHVITGNEYTISFMTQVHAGTFATPWVFIESMQGDVANENWIALQPVQDADNFEANAPRVWSMQNSTRFSTAATVQSEAVKTDNWFNVTFVMTEKMGTLYVDGVAVAKAYVQNPDLEYNSATYGFPPKVVSDVTNVYLGVNYWDDVPLNGEIDELYIYNEALEGDDLKDLIGNDVVDSITLEPLAEDETQETMTPSLADKDDANLFDIEEGSNDDKNSSDNTMMIVIIAVVVVVVVVVVIAAVVASKKKNSDDDSDEE